MNSKRLCSISNVDCLVLWRAISIESVVHVGVYKNKSVTFMYKWLCRLYCLMCTFIYKPTVVLL